MNMLDYLDWRGDLSFAAAELNEVDALIFAWLIYYRFEDLGEAEIENRSFAELAALHERKFGPFVKIDLASSISPSAAAAWVLHRASLAPRFSAVRVCDFKRMFDPAKGVQFAAISFLAGEKTRVVAFRGTDNTLAGWKEDCYLALSEAVPAQKLAVQYLEGTADGREALVCGHSKGGNLAMYAALFAKEARLEDVRAVYNFDGPGFSFELRGMERYERLRNRIATIVPESSIVGMLLNHEEDYQIVASQMMSILQHDAMFWKVLGPRLVRTDKRNASSVVVDNALREWIDGMTMDERKSFVDGLFSLLEGTGAQTTDELPERIAQSGLRALAATPSFGPQQKQMVLRLLLNLVKAGNASLYESVMRNDAERELAQNLTGGAGRVTGALDRALESLAARFAAKAKSKSTAGTLPEGGMSPKGKEPH